MSTGDGYADGLLAGALRLAESGVFVFPVHVKGFTPDGTKDMYALTGWRELSTRDARTIRGWFGPRRQWRGRSVGIDTGKSGLVVLDPDGAEGIANWRAFCDEHRIGATYRAITPGGGEHHYFRADPEHVVGNDKDGKIAKSVDVRGAGGLVIAPPSRDARGVYQFVEGEPPWAELPVVPTVIVERMTAPREAQAKSAGLSHRAPAGEPTRPPGEVHPYVAATFAGVVDEFAAITGVGNGRSGKLAGAALRLSKFANAHHNGLPPTGLTEDAVRTALLAAADRNGFTAAHGKRYTVYQVDRGLEDGRDKVPKGWPPPERELSAHGMTRADARRMVDELGMTPDDIRDVLAANGAPEVWTRLDLDGLFGTRSAATPVDPPAASSDGSPSGRLAALLADLRTWMHLPDPTPLLAALAVAVTAEDGQGDPAWLLLVSSPSGGKTELVRLFDAIVARRLDDVTVGGLLTWSKGKRPRPVGLLANVHRGLVSFGDLSSMLAGSDHRSRDHLFALLRRVADGEVNRDIAPPSGEVVDGSLHWRGRVQIIGAVTGVIDRYANHNAALGDRWLLCRMVERRRAAALCRPRDLPGHRDRTMKLVGELVHAARAQLSDDDVSDELFEVIADVAQVTALGRSSVPRASWGRREIEGQPITEAPWRLIRQLSEVARGLRALGLDDGRSAAVCRRLACDSMPTARLGPLVALAASPEPRSTAQVARAASLHWHVAARQLEELALIGVVDSLSLADDGSEQPDVVISDSDISAPDRRVSTRWRLSPDDADLISRVVGPLTSADMSHKSGEVYRAH